jgi:hypothetical protein
MTEGLDRQGRFAVVVVYNGLKRELQVEPHESMASVTERAISLFEVSEQRHLLALFDTNNREFTDLSESAAQAGLHAGEVLVLRQSQVRGG